MIPALTCLLLPLASQCAGLVRETPRIADVVQHRSQYNGKAVRVTGRVQRLDRWTSSSGLPEEVFLLCDDGCVRVYVRANSAIRNGALATVEGMYYAAYRAGRATYYNEVEGSEVLPRE